MTIQPSDLRSVPEEWLQRELRARRHCLDCGAEWSRGWYPANRDHTRIRCFTCAAKRRLAQRRKAPLFQSAEATA